MFCSAALVLDLFALVAWRLLYACVAVSVDTTVSRLFFDGHHSLVGLYGH